jgi:tripartite-type tricarboxylate transporter receptor subunit TctC
MKIRGLLFASLAMAAMASVTAVQAQTAAEFYQKKGLKIMLGHPPGGSYDLYARLAAAHLKKYLPLPGAIIIQHKPGGGGIIAVNYFYANVPRDGSMVGLFPESLAQTQMMEPKLARWKMQEMKYVGSFAPVNAAFVVRKGAPAMTIEDMKTRQLSVGCSGKASQSYQYPAMLKALAGFKFKMICGYRGSKAFVLATERGEVDMVASAWNTWRSIGKQYLDTGKMKVIMQAGVNRDKEMANIPLMQEVVSDPKTREILEYVSSGSAIGRALITPPKVPADRLALLRAAFQKVVKDREFLAQAEKLSAAIYPSTGEAMDALVAKTLQTPKAIVDAAAKAMQ